MATSLNTSYEQSIKSPDSNSVRTKTPFITGRVTKVVEGPLIPGTKILDPDYRNPSDLGKIRYQLLESGQGSTLNSTGNPTAKPLHSAFKQYPVIGEIVLIFPGPSTKLNIKKGEQEFYYLPPYNIWSASHHNAFPDLNDYAAYTNKVNTTYEQATTLNQTTNVSTSGSVNYPLGYDFPEKANIKPLRLFAGDTTIEGRWGNSIRFGSTTTDKTENYWSSTGTPGDPITIIRNGQGAQSTKVGYVPTIENINRDPSSIYLTNGQKIVIDDITKNFNLASLGVTFTGTAATTAAIPIQQQLTSIDTISPAAQDQRISNSNK
jgi:hypothetical protein